MNQLYNLKKLSGFTIILLNIMFLSGCSKAIKNGDANITASSSLNVNVVSSSTIQQSSSTESETKESDGEMVLSPDKKYGVFLIEGRIVKDKVAETTSHYNEVLMFDFASRKKDVLVKSGNVKDLKIGNITKDNFPFDEIHDLSLGDFSSDGKYFYFASYAWSTSYAVFSVDISTKEIKFITDSNYLEVIKTGKYKDMLLTNHHRYHDGGPSYDYYYITDPKTGKDVKSLGETIKL